MSQTPDGAQPVAATQATNSTGTGTGTGTAPPEIGTAPTMTLTKPQMIGLGAVLLVVLLAIGFVLLRGGGDDPGPDIDIAETELDLAAASSPIVELGPTMRWELDDGLYTVNEGTMCSYSDDIPSRCQLLAVRLIGDAVLLGDADLQLGSTLEVMDNSELVTSGSGCPEEVELWTEKDGAPSTPVLCVETDQGATFVIYQMSPAGQEPLHLVAFEVDA